MTDRNKNLFGYSLLLIQPIFMASNLVVARGGVEYVPPLSLAFWRWVTVFVILLPFTFSALAKNIEIIKKEYKQLFFLGAMGCGVCGAFPFLAGETTTITNMGIIYTSSPVFIIIISYFFFNEKINLTKFVGLVSCLIGVFAIIIKGDVNLLLSLKFTVGDLWMLGAAIGWALYSIYLFYWRTDLAIFQRFTLVAFFGALSLMPFYLIEQFIFEPTSFNSDFFAWVIFAAISPGIIAFTLYTMAQKRLGASITGFTLYIFTVYGAVYGYFLFNEQFEFYHLIGTILVFFGVSLAKRKNEKKIKDIFLYFLIAIPTVYILLLLFLYFYQRNLLYHPNENNYFGDNLKIEVDRIKIKTSDNLDLNAWYYEKDKNKFKTLLFFHGNAGLLENRIYKLNALDKLDLNILIIAWRGFSGNEGKPNEKGLYEDGKSAIDWLLNNGVKERNIILYGESLGTGIATHLAQKRDFAGVILETPFTSMIDAAKTFYPYVPVNILLKDRYENKSKIVNINSPILIMHGEIDNIVPFHMGKKLFEIANEPKTFYSTKTDNHMMEYDDKLINELDIFIKSLN